MRILYAPAKNVLFVKAYNIERSQEKRKIANSIHREKIIDKI